MFIYQKRRLPRKNFYKRIALRWLYWMLVGLKFFKKFLSLLFVLFYWLVKPLLKGIKIILVFIFLKIYKFFFLFKKWFLNFFWPSRSKIFYPLSRRYVFHFTLMAIFFLTVTANVSAREGVQLPDIKQKSILFKLVNGEETEMIEESNLTVSKVKNYLNEGLRADISLGGNDIEDKPKISYGGSTLVKPEIISNNQKTRTEIEHYIVKEGDTISSIAENFGIHVNTILWANKLTARDLIRPGDKLVILPVDGVLHQVKKGDNLEKIAKYYKADADKILEFNKLADASDIVIGENLIVPDGEMPAPAPSVVSGIKRLLPVKNFYISPKVSIPSGFGMFWPTAARRITQYFSWRHHAVDIAGPIGTPVYAAESGTIKFTGWGTGYGNHIDIDHGNGTITRYAHLSKILVSKGDRVEKGETIGLIGSTGWSTGPHLHFEVIKNGQKYNPLEYIR